MATRVDRKQGDEARIRRYEKPVVVDLGEVARGAGASCLLGSAATGACNTGASPTGACKSGSSPTGTCDIGAGN